MVRRHGFTASALCVCALLVSGSGAVLAQRQPQNDGAPQREAPQHQAPAPTPAPAPAPPPPAPAPPPTPQYTPPPSPPPQYTPPPAPRYEPPPAPRYEPPAPQRETPRYEPPPTPRYEPPTPQRETPRYEPTPTPRYEPPPTPRYEPPQNTQPPSPQRLNPRVEMPREAPQSEAPAQAPRQSMPPVQQPQRMTPRNEMPTEPRQVQTPGYQMRAPSPSGGPAIRPGSAAPIPSPGPAAVRAPAARPAPRAVYATTPAAIASRAANGSTVLNASGSSGVIQQVNASRLFMRGINARPIPQGAVTVQPDGNLTVKTAAGAQLHVRKTGSLASVALRDRTLDFRPDGRLRRISTATTDIVRGVHGERVVIRRRPDQRVLVSTGPGRGFIERAGMVGNRPIIEQTHVAGGRLVLRAFMGYSYRGLELRRFIHPVFHKPAFYDWALRRWAQPIFYAWPWFGEPWCGYYSGYFQPYSAYPDAASWLTDYILSETLSDGYAMENQAEPLEGFEGGWAGMLPDDELYAADDWLITPEVKAAIAEEITRQLEEEKATAAGAPENAEELAAALKPGRLFVVSSVLDVMTPEERSCELTPGDVLRLSAAPAENATVASLGVLASKRRDCPAGAIVNVPLRDLADMLNSMRALLDAGLEQLRNSGNTGGLPFAPPEAISEPPRPGLPGFTAAPEPNAAALLDEQRRAAGAIEKTAVQEIPLDR